MSRRSFTAAELTPDREYRVVRAFADYDGILHAVGESWRFLAKDFLPYEDGLTLFVEREGKKIPFRLQWRVEAQGHIIDQFHDFVEEVVSIPEAFGGGCACGAIRYECSASPTSMVNCHCRACQRAGGSGYSPSVVVRRSAFRVVAGEPRLHSVAAESGNIAHRAFCSECGAPLFASTSAHPDVVAIRAGSLDDPSWFHADADVWVEGAQPWDLMDPSIPKFAGSRPRGASDEKK